MSRDIHGRIYRLVVDLISFSKAIPRSQVNFILVNQFLRAATSIGANCSKGRKGDKVLVKCPN